MAQYSPCRPGTLPDRLNEILRQKSPLAVAFSGGLDSRFLCFAALGTGVDVLAIHANGPHIAPDENEYARHWAQKKGLPFTEIYVDPLKLPAVCHNNKDRCYACKRELFGKMREKLAQLGEGGRTLCDGGNLDDPSAFRPGLRAVGEEKVLSPLALAGMDKATIRKFAGQMGMDYIDQAPRPCLLTRLAYGIPPQEEVLRRIAEAESEIRDFLARNNLRQCDFRLRLLQAPQLHMTLALPALEQELHDILRKHGFCEAKILHMPKLSGFFDRV